MYLQIADDITTDDVKSIHDAIAQGGVVYVVHSICRTLEGRRTMIRRLKRAGCKPDIVRNLGWATAFPATDRPVKKVQPPKPAPKTSRRPKAKPKELKISPSEDGA